MPFFYSSSINNEAFTSSTSESTSENVSLNDQQGIFFVRFFLNIVLLLLHILSNRNFGQTSGF